MFMICAAFLCTVAPGGDPGCQVYVAGDTLARREIVEVKTKCVDLCGCMTWSECFYVMYV